MNLADKVTIPPQVMARQVGDETVILDLASGSYYGLDAVGARIWQLLGEDKNLAEVCEAMLAEYDVTREEFERDLDDLLTALAGKGLIGLGSGG